jgi:hypothetical protein
MPVVYINENITQLHNQMLGMREELLRLEGVLRTFEGFKKAGLTQIDLPNQPVEPTEELESIQEKPE